MPRPLKIAGLIVCFVLAFAQPAFAWYNGPNGGAGYGTHDWILSQACKMATSQDSHWVNVAVATKATLEPDKLPRDQVNHSYDRWGKTRYGTAPTKIASVYRSAVAAYRSGDTTAASRYVGILSHYYADVCEPLHTDGAPGGTKTRRLYERGVDSMLTTSTSRPTWAAYDGYQYVTDPSWTGVSAAKTAHKSYALLLKRYAKRRFTSGVTSITRAQLNRAANGVADLIMSIEQDAVRVTVSPNLSAHQGVATNGSDYWVFHTTWIARYDTDWHLAAFTDTPTADLGLVRPHLGDGCYHDGKLYVPAENYPYPSSPYLLVFDSATLSREATIALDTTEEVSAVTIAPDEGAHGVIYVSSYFDSTHLSRFDLSDYSRLPDLPLNPAPRPGIQGLARLGDTLYCSVGIGGQPGYLYEIAPGGATGLRFIDRTKGTHEGIDMRDGNLLWLIDDTGVRSHAYTLNLHAMWSR